MKNSKERLDAISKEFRRRSKERKKSGKSSEGEYEKLHYYGELMEIARKLEEFKKGKEDPN